MTLYVKSVFSIVVGECPATGRIGIFVDAMTTPPIEFYMPNERAHVTIAYCTLIAPKKTLFTTLIHALRRNDIYPNNDPEQFKPGQNPSNKTYTQLPPEKLQHIMEVIRRVASGIDFTLSDASEPDIIQIPESLIKERLLDRRPKPLPSVSTAIIIEQKNISEIAFG